jgi:hypothetical protein
VSSTADLPFVDSAGIRTAGSLLFISELIPA